MLVVNNNKMQKVLSIATTFIGGEHLMVQACEFCGDDSCGMWDNMDESDDDPAYRPYEDTELFADDFMSADRYDRYNERSGYVRDYYPEDYEVPRRSSYKYDSMNNWESLFQGSSMRGLFSKIKRAVNKKAAVAIGTLPGDEANSTPMDTALSFLNMGGASAVAVLNWDIEEEEERMGRAQSPHRASVVSPSRAKLLDMNDVHEEDAEYMGASPMKQNKNDDVIMGDFLTNMLDKQAMENPMGRGPKRQIRAEAEDRFCDECSADVYLKGKIFTPPAHGRGKIFTHRGNSRGYRRTIEL
jgi:hypothetical protein